MWKKLRILILMIILIMVGVNAWRDYNPNWDKPMIVLLHPINADGQTSTAQYMQQLSSQNLSHVQDYIQAMSAQYRDQPVSVYFQLGRELSEVPPKVPERDSILQAIFWSLKFRFYAWRQHDNKDGSPSVTLFLNYYDPRLTRTLTHSTALQNGRIGSINLFASTRQTEQNRIILVHELFHALGASDKYDLLTGLPHYPDGYADPDQKPLYPQIKAELMAGHIALSETKSVMPAFLDQTVINQKTADELGWEGR